MKRVTSLLLFLPLALGATDSGRASSKSESRTELEYALNTPLPFTIDHPEKVKPAELIRASKLYWYIVEQVARKVNPQNPPKLRPRVHIVIGAESIEGSNSPELMTLWLPEWSETMFATAVAEAATAQIVKPQDLADSINTAYVYLNAIDKGTVDAKRYK